MHTFFVDKIGKEVSLSEIESKHAVKVLRLNIGDLVRVIDGQGTEAFGKIKTPHHKCCEVSIDKVLKQKEPLKEIAIALSPTKSNDRTEWFLEKAIEIGITRFIPIICKNSERKKFNSERWNKIAISALKQSKRLWIPIIEAPIKFDDFITKTEYTHKFIAHCEGGSKNELKNYINSEEHQLILIGPEGDFTPNEIELAIKNDFTPVSLGENRLRTETAGVVACTLMKFG